MPLSPIQREIAKVIGYNPLSDDDAAEPVDLSCCRLKQGEKDGWPVVRWRGEWHFVPTMDEVEQYVFDSTCPTPNDSDVEPDHPESWLSLLGLI